LGDFRKAGKIWRKCPSELPDCGYPVEKSATVGQVDMAPHVLYAAKSATGPDSEGTFRNLFDQKSPGQLADEFDEEIHDQHVRIVALSGQSEKAGKSGWDAHLANPLNFPAFSMPVFWHNLNRLMDQKDHITPGQMYPHFTEAQLAEAESNIRRYLAVVLRIAERLEAAGRHFPGPDGGDLTDPDTQGTIPDERSKNIPTQH
jgi:hypothetical protein